MKRTNVVIFGTGRAAQSHISILKKNKKIRILGVFGKNKKRLNILKKKYGVKIFQNLNQVFKDKPEVSLIANQNFKHYSDALFSLKNGSDVLVEKPLTTNVKNTQKLIRFAKKNKKKLSVVLQRRYDASTVYLKKLVKKNFFGNLIFVKLNVFMNRKKEYFDKIFWLKDRKKSGGGVLIHHAIHSIDQLLYILQKKPINVKAFTSNKIMQMSVEDTAIAIIKFDNNILATVHASYCANKKIRNSIEIYGDKKSIVLSGDKIEYLNKSNKKLHKIFSTHSRGSYNKVWSDFISNQKSKSTADSYLKTEQLINKMYQ